MEYYNSLKLKTNPYPQNPSTFSSTLLDAIYRSIDEIDGGAGAGEQDMTVYRETTKKQSISGFEYHDEDIARHRRVCLIEKWMEKKVTQSRRRSVPDFDRNPWGLLTHSSSSSSDSSSAGGFSSSEADSIYKPKPVISSVFWGSSKTGEIKKQRKSKTTHDHNHNHNHNHNHDHDKKSKKTTTKNQPMSPGGRLTSFLNSLFTTNKSKSDDFTASAAAATASTCSSASSFSRSCLSTGSKTSKRSVRFNVDDDYQPYSRQKSLNTPIPTKNSNIIKHEVTKIQIQEKKKYDDHKMSHEEDDDDDDDGASCASSDLFELDNLSVIGIDRYCKELPVYETTHVHTNRAIANGLIN